MVYNIKNLVEFGNYLLSEERMKRMVTSGMERGATMFEIHEALKSVYDADIQNFLDIKAKENLFEEEEADVIQEIDDKLGYTEEVEILKRIRQSLNSKENIPHYKNNISEEDSDKPVIIIMRLVE